MEIGTPEVTRDEGDLAAFRRKPRTFGTAGPGDCPDCGDVLGREPRALPVLPDPDDGDGYAGDRREGDRQAEDLPAPFEVGPVNSEHLP